jgi:hypothetical protein
MAALNKTFLAQITSVRDDKSNIDQSEETSSFFHYSLKIPL